MTGRKQVCTADGGMTGQTCTECFTILPASGDCMCGWGLPGVAVKDTISMQVAGEHSRLTRLLQSPDNPQVVLPAPGYVDQDALSRFDWHTALIPELLREMRGKVAPLRAATTDDVKVSTSKGNAPAPLNENAVDAADELWVIIVEWVTEVAERLGITPPFAVKHVWKHNGGTYGFPAGKDGQDAYLLGWDVQRWLDRHHENIVDLAYEMWEQESFAFDALRRARAQWMNDRRSPVKVVNRSRCMNCLDGAIEAHVVEAGGREYWVSQCALCGDVEKTYRMTKEGMTKVESVDKDLEPKVLAVCPECVAGKCGNCDGSAWDDRADMVTVCGCKKVHA